MDISSQYLSLTGGECTLSPGSILTPVIAGGSSCTLELTVDNTTPVGNLETIISVNYNGRGDHSGGADVSKTLSLQVNPPAALYGVSGDNSPTQPSSLYSINMTDATPTFLLDFNSKTSSPGEAIASDGNDLYHFSGYGSSMDRKTIGQSFFKRK